MYTLLATKIQVPIHIRAKSSDGNGKRVMTNVRGSEKSEAKRHFSRHEIIVVHADLRVGKRGETPEWCLLFRAHTEQNNSDLSISDSRI